MKNNLKGNKGITLIALIITVVVLLILAAVTINSVSEGGIFSYANNAATKYNSAATEENSLLTNWMIQMKDYDKDDNDGDGDGDGDGDKESTKGWWDRLGLTSSNVVYGSTYTFNDKDDSSITYTVNIEENSLTFNKTGFSKPININQAAMDEAAAIFEQSPETIIAALTYSEGTNKFAFADLSSGAIIGFEFIEDGKMNLYYDSNFDDSLNNIFNGTTYKKNTEPVSPD